jgi:hypothetical protein
MKKTKTIIEPVKAVHFRLEVSGVNFIICRDQGSGFKPCGKDGLWSETPHLYRNQYLAQLALDFFFAHS